MRTVPRIGGLACVCVIGVLGGALPARAGASARETLTLDSGQTLPAPGFRYTDGVFHDGKGKKLARSDVVDWWLTAPDADVDPVAGAATGDDTALDVLLRIVRVLPLVIGALDREVVGGVKNVVAVGAELRLGVVVGKRGLVEGRRIEEWRLAMYNRCP